MKRCSMHACVGLIWVSPVAAQAPRTLFSRFNDADSTVLVHHGVDAPSARLVRVSSSAVQESVIALMAKPRDVANIKALNAVDASTLVFAGATASNQGELRLFHDSGNGFALSSTYTEAGSDFVGVAYSRARQRLYLLDSLKQRIIYADMSSASTALPQLWSVLVTSQQLPGLAGVSDYRLSLSKASDGPAPILAAHPLRAYPGDTFTITDSATVPTSVIPGDHSVARIMDAHVTSSAASLTVKGPPGVSVDVESAITGMSYGSAITAMNGVAAVPLQPGIVLGDIVVARRAGAVAGTPYFCSFQRWGFSESLSMGIAIEDIGRACSMNAWTNNAIFGVNAFLKYTGTPNPSNFAASLVVGTESDVYAIGGGQYALFGSAVFQSTAYVDPGRLPVGFATADLPIPGDQTLVGTTVCFQWWINDGPAIRVSNVACILIRDAEFVPASPAALSRGRPGTLTPRRTSNSETRRALAEWLRKCGARILTNDEQYSSARRFIKARR